MNLSSSSSCCSCSNASGEATMRAEPFLARVGAGDRWEDLAGERGDLPGDLMEERRELLSDSACRAAALLAASSILRRKHSSCRHRNVTEFSI